MKKLRVHYLPFLLIPFFMLSSCKKEAEEVTPTKEVTEETSSKKKPKGHTKSANSLRYNEVSFKGSHNSYERRETIAEQLSSSGPAYDNRCLSLEFDIWRNTSSFTDHTNIASNFFVVAHIFHPGKYGTTLRHYLQQVKAWSTANPNHEPIMVILDVKSKNGGYQNFHSQIDSYIRRYYGDNGIFFPNQTFVDRARSLRHNVRYNNGWPTMHQLRGKVLFVLSGNQNWGGEYAKKDPKYRHCFVMKNLEVTNNDPTSYANSIHNQNPNIVFFNFNLGNANGNHRFGTLAKELGRKGAIVRGYTANNSSAWNKSKQNGVSCISTDKIRHHSWARISSTSSVNFIQRAL